MEHVIAPFALVAGLWVAWTTTVPFLILLGVVVFAGLNVGLSKLLERFPSLESPPISRFFINVTMLAFFGAFGGPNGWLMALPSMVGGTFMPSRMNAVVLRVACLLGYGVGAISSGHSLAGLGVPLLVLLFVGMLGEAAYIPLREAMVESRQREHLLAASQARAEQALSFRKAFLATMSHEIRMPMNGVIGMAELLGGTRLDPEQQDMVEVIRGSGQGLLRIINDILELSRLEAGRLATEQVAYSPAAVVGEVVELLRHGDLSPKVTLDAEVDGLPPWVKGDPGRLRQVLLNVTGNACKFTSQGSVRVVARWRDDRLEVSVVDTGIGISTEALDRLFQPFVQADSSTARRFGGTGLGLSIARRLVELMGGSLKATSKEGHGSTFSFAIAAPLADAPVALPSERTASPDAPEMVGEGLHVLVVDDNPVNLLVAVAMLRRLGATVSSATSGAEALSAVRDHTYDLVLMDVQMPEMDGLEATRRLRDAGYQSPILALTAGVTEDERTSCLAAGMDAVLAKPVTLDSARGALNRWVGTATTGRLDLGRLGQGSWSQSARCTGEGRCEHPLEPLNASDLRYSGWTTLGVSMRPFPLLAVLIAAACTGSGTLKLATSTTDSGSPTTDDTSPVADTDTAEPSPPAVRITELMYNPVMEVDYEDHHEFIELHNAGDAAVDLTGWNFDKGITYTFSDRVLGPGETLVLAVDRDALLAAWPDLDPALVVGDWEGALANGGERLRLLDADGNTIEDLTWTDSAPWPVGADGLGASDDWLPADVLPLEDHQFRGRSLQRVSLTAETDQPGNWQASPLDGMDPGSVASVAGSAALVVVTDIDWGTTGPLAPDTELTLTVTTSGPLPDARLEWFADDISRDDETAATVALTATSDTTYVATLPAQPDQTILRVRVLGDAGAGDTTVTPRAGDPFQWLGRFVGAPIDGETRPYRIFIDPGDWTSMWDDATGGRVTGCDKNPGWEARVPAVFVHEGEVYDVLVRYQGSRWNRTNGQTMSSWSAPGPERPAPLKALSWSVKFPRYRTLDGRERLSLNKLTQSCPGSSTVVGFQLFEAVGLPVPDTRYVRLFVNGAYYHYMLEVESPGEEMLERWVADHAATDEPDVPHLFKSGGCNCDEGPYGWGDERPLAEACGWSVEERYAATYERKTWDWDDHSELQALIEGLDAARAGSDADLRQFLDDHFDTAAVLSYMAVMNWGAPFDDMFQNHYLLQRRSDGRWLMAPWDLDLDFGGWHGAHASIYLGEEGDPDNRSGWWNRIKDSFLRVYRSEYDARLAELNETVLHPDTVVPLVDANEADWTLSEVTATPAPPYCDFTAGAERFRTFARDRHDVVAGVLGGD